jgi:hypothetical protein
VPSIAHASRRRDGPGQQLVIACRCCRDLQLRETRPRPSQIAAVWVSRWVSTPATMSASMVLLTGLPPPVRCLNDGTGLEGNSRGNPVMSHGREGPDKLLIRPTRVARPVLAAPGTSPSKDTPPDGQARRESPGTTSNQPARTRPRERPVPASPYSQARKESPGAASHQPWPAPAINHGRYRQAKTHRHGRSTTALGVPGSIQRNLAWPGEFIAQNGPPCPGSRSDRVRPGLDSANSAETIERRGGKQH